jgi:hypothetical protein
MATIYRSKTAKYRISKETRGDGTEWFYPEKCRGFLLFRYEWAAIGAHRDYVTALRQISEQIIADDEDYRAYLRCYVVKREIL